uniref:Uncharacterized protein n=1 Tax=Paenarthrobacter nicotinovorans TaxID=29320 RepID=Q8GAM9_PAENI|nr:hypothetical protein [Paenarthrobacter nicotinovorans]
MGFITRRLVPRKIRRAAHPVRTAKRAVYRATVPRSVRRSVSAARKVAHPVRTAGYAAENAIFGPHRRRPSRTGASVAYGTYGVRHRSPRSAANCRKCNQIPSAFSHSPTPAKGSGKSSPRIGGMAAMGVFALIGFSSGGGGAILGLLLVIALLTWALVAFAVRDH